MGNNILDALHVQVVGSGQRFLVFAHGFGTDQSAWQRILPFFVPHYRVPPRRHDHRGDAQHRGTPSPPQRPEPARPSPPASPLQVIHRLPLAVAVAAAKAVQWWDPLLTTGQSMLTRGEYFVDTGRDIIVVDVIRTGGKG
ncbi:hypothetical protein CRG98_037892 [Punica granatum]|uniref:Uncharacterized protein n=1 Tax=Punica granatum TaxID=22663 RepID=A0A2I0IDE9_PUNGR|nr:hypothetical protein CRG98_037892 [Punica granatum]